MAFYETSVVTGATASAAAHCSLRTGASDVSLRFVEFFNTVATANAVGIGYKGAGTVTPTTSQLGTVLGGVKPASLENVDTAWSAAPAIPATFFKRMSIAASQGTGMIFTWQKDGPLIIPANSTIVLWNIGAAAGGILYFNFEWEV